jgi:hypothetical protein
MTTLQPRHRVPARIGSGPRVSVGGAAWPVYKLIAVVASLLTAVMVGAATVNAELTTWLVVVVAVSSWWGARAILARH